MEHGKMGFLHSVLFLSRQTQYITSHPRSLVFLPSHRCLWAHFILRKNDKEAYALLFRDMAVSILGHQGDGIVDRYIAPQSPLAGLGSNVLVHGTIPLVSKDADGRVPFEKCVRLFGVLVANGVPRDAQG